MARPLRIEYEGAFYHIIQRGIERRSIFKVNKDKERFLSYLEQAHTAYAAVIHTYILMDNHYHIILETPRGNLSKIMHYLNTSYAVYFNTKHKRTGPLYQGRFKAVLVQQDEYLHYLSRYIHLNPVRAGIVKTPEEYRWSSCRYFTVNHTPPAWLCSNCILLMFHKNAKNARRLYRQFIQEGMGNEKYIIEQNIHKSIILGTDDFVDKIIDTFLDIDEDSEIPALKELKRRKGPSLPNIKDIVVAHIRDNTKLQRRMLLYLSRKYTQKSLNEIASFFGKIKDSGVSQAYKRIEQARKKDSKLNRLADEIGKKIEMSIVET